MTTSSQNLEQDIYISDYLPEGITPVEESETVSIRITLEQIIKKTIETDTSTIGFSSLGSGLRAEIIDDTDRISIIVSGRISVLNGITDENANVVINCSGLDEGVYTLPVDIKNIDNSCKILDTNKLRVRIYDIAQEQETQPPENTTEAPIAATTPNANNTPTLSPAPSQSPDEGSDSNNQEEDREDNDSQE